MKQDIIPEAFLGSEVHIVKYLEDLIMVEEPYEAFLIASLWYVKDSLCQFTVIRIHEADHFGKGFDGRKTVISRSGKVLTLLLKVIEKQENELRGEMLHPEGPDLDTVMFSRIGHEELEGIPVGPVGIMTDPLDVGKIMIEELMNRGRELHSFLLCQR